MSELLRIIPFKACIGEILMDLSYALREDSIMKLNKGGMRFG